MNEIAILEKYTHVRESFPFLFREIEKHEITGFYLALPDTLAVFAIHICYRALQRFVIDIFVHGAHESRAIGTRAGSSPVTVRGA